MGGGGGKGGKGGSGKIKVPFYHISMHIGLCHSDGEAELISFYAGDKLVSDTNISGITGERIYKEKLFGGPRKEGGLKGSLWYYTGLATQTMFGPHAARLGRTMATCPGFRGIASVWLTGFHSGLRTENWKMDNPKGFYIGSGNPYIKPFKFRIRRKPVTGPHLSDSTAMIRIQDRVNGQPMYAVNPAHILFEIYTNRSWGEGRSVATIDTASFDAAATTLFNEDFGLSFAWMRQTTIEKVVQEIIDHIQASVYDDPETGLLTIKLLRDDYNTAELREVNPSNAKLSRFRRKLWGEVSSEVVVTWTNPEDEREMTVTAHNLSAAIAQGGIPVSTSRNFYMVRSPDLAIRLAERELKMLSYPLAAIDAEVFREFSKTVPGDVVRVNWPDKNIIDMPMRVMEVVGSGSSSDKIILKLQEDIFSLPSTHYLKSVKTLWDSGSTGASANFSAYTMPAYVTAKVLGYATTDEIPYPAAVAGFLGERATSKDTDFDLRGPVVLPTGDSKEELLTVMYYPTKALTETEMFQGVFTTVTLGSLQGPFPIVGDFVVFSELGPNGEIGAVTAVDSSNRQVTIMRGVLDTVPKVWGLGTELFFFNPLQDNISDPNERASGETINYTIDPNTVNWLGFEVGGENVNLSVTLNDRAHMPLRPANVRVANNAWGPVRRSSTANIPVTWENRNRVTESDQVLEWNAGNSSPETGQTTTVSVRYPLTGNIIQQYTGLTGTSFSIPYVDLGGVKSFLVGVSSERDGFTSFNEHRIPVYVDMDVGLTPSETITPGSAWSPSAAQRGSSFGVVIPSVPLPNSTGATGVLLDAGGLANGLSIFARGNGTVRVQAGNGSASPTAQSAWVDIPISNRLGQTVEIAAQVEMPAMTLKVWVNGEIQGTSTPAGTPLGTWAGGDAGAYGVAAGFETAGNITTPWPRTLTSDARIHYGVLLG